MKFSSSCAGVQQFCLASGTGLHNYGKSPFLTAKLTINGHVQWRYVYIYIYNMYTYHIHILDYERVCSAHVLLMFCLSRAILVISWI